MFSKSLIASIFLLASISFTNAHAGVNPALGVKGQMVRSDVQRPSANSPCGNVNVAQNLDSSTAVQADASGNFSPSITDFNGGADGSRSIQKVQVDASGTGKNLVAAKMVVNGNANPATVGTDKLTAQLPAGTKCTGGASKNLCLASFTTTAGFGNCVVVSQGAGASNASAPATRSILLRNGAAKGMKSSTSPAADGDKKSQSGKKEDSKKGKGSDKKKGKKDDKKKDDKKGKDDKKDDKKGKGDKQDDKKGKNDLAQNDKKGKDDKKKGKDDKKKGKGGKKDDKKDNKKGKSDLSTGDKKGKDDKKKKDDKKGKGDKKKAASGDAKSPKRSWSSRQLLERID